MIRRPPLSTRTYTLFPYATLFCSVSVVLKVLGATRGDILRAWAAEFLLLGVVTGAIGAALGTLTAFVVVTEVMNLPWSFAPSALAASVIGCIAITLLLGFVGLWRALRQHGAPRVRKPVGRGQR